MNKIEGFMIQARNRAYLATEAFKDKLTKKESGDSQLVVALVLIAIALGLCIVFRNQIQAVMTNLMSKLTEAIQKFSDGVVNP